MKYIILILEFIFCVTFSFAQKLAVESFTHDKMNLEARLDSGRTDLNGKLCALVKVMVLDDIVNCEGGNVGTIITKGTVKKIFVSPSARYIKLEFKYHYPLKITFEDYGYKTLTESATYEVSIVDANASVQPSNQQQVNSAAQQTPHQQTTTPQRSQSQPVQYSNGYGNILPITVNGVTFNMIKVEGGSFFMGATKKQRNSDDDEKPAHQVTLSTYYIGETEVTQTLWTAIMGNNPSNFKGDNLPVETISWNDCQKFIDKLNNLTGRYFRLPTEAEWEYASYGGNKGNGTQYSGSNNIDEVAWYWQNCGDKYLSGDWDWNKIEKNNCKPHPVKTKKANELGIYDMSGNVWEWCQDWYGSYESNAQTNPTGPDSGTRRVTRGGSWNNYARGCRSAVRYSNSPEGRDDYLGLRLALSEYQ
ncbi:formylglycine-generating enzyme family protein [Prevotella sp. P5-92]|uniref:formylglycine-generating enzyme family protein n=1 Tax=Prevotella sp. P5-92 TaxID=2024222 RepID=UPI0020B168BD|nr:formylglycine-generating enzyme family protein [Prevotella sp. P5-92]